MWKGVTALVTLASLAATTDVEAQQWPTRPLTMINPFAAGGPNDVLARLFAQRMGEILGQSIIIENVGDAGGMNGADRVAKAKDMKEFVASAKANTDKMQFASAGTGSAIHLGCALMNMVAGLDIVHVPYRGANPACRI
jgi:tripartite-type tricarboxylate transporter receptor subunit TctC